MLNLSNEAIRRMYWACKENDCFPGDLPVDEDDRNISIHAILGGLGLLTNGMLPFDDHPVSPSDESSSRHVSQSNPSGRPPRANSGSSNPSMNGIYSSSFNSIEAFPSRNSVHSSTSHHSFEGPPVSPTTQTHSFDSIQQSHHITPPFLHDLDYLTFSPQNTILPMVSLAGADCNVMQQLRNDFLFPWPGTFAAAMDTTGYQQQI